MNRKHILVAEREIGLQRILSLTLKSENFSISTVDDCSLVMAKISESAKDHNPVSMLLVDTNSPDGCCENMAETLLQIGEGIPIVALVRYGDEEIINQEFRDRCALMISKPVEAAELIAGIHKVLSWYN